MTNQTESACNQIERSINHLERRLAQNDLYVYDSTERQRDIFIISSARMAVRDIQNCVMGTPGVGFTLWLSGVMLLVGVMIGVSL